MQDPEGLKFHTFPESEWAMFSAKDPLSGTLQSLNTQVWKEWYPNEGQNIGETEMECWKFTPTAICKPEEENEREAAEMVSAMTMTGIL